MLFGYYNIKKVKFPQKFIDGYDADGLVINRENFRTFIKL
jgi:hypothetical protein